MKEKRYNGGRRLKLTEELIKNICDAISQGNTFKTSAEVVGISEGLFYKWRNKAEEIQDRVNQFYDNLEDSEEITEGIILTDELELDEKEELFLLFLQSIKKAEAEAVQRNVAIINVAGKKNWQASAWWLERRYPKDFARKEKLDLDLKGSMFNVNSYDVSLTEEEEADYKNQIKGFFKESVLDEDR